MCLGFGPRQAWLVGEGGSSLGPRSEGTVFMAVLRGEGPPCPPPQHHQRGPNWAAGGAGSGWTQCRAHVWDSGLALSQGPCSSLPRERGVSRSQRAPGLRRWLCVRRVRHPLEFQRGETQSWTQGVAGVAGEAAGGTQPPPKHTRAGSGRQAAGWRRQGPHSVLCPDCPTNRCWAAPRAGFPE